MSENSYFVGREGELKRFVDVLANPAGQAIVVVGQTGMGKTTLVNKFMEMAINHRGLNCGCVRYEVTRTDGVKSTMELMMDHAYAAAGVIEGSFSGTDQRLEQWRSFLNVFKIGDLVMSLKRDPQKDTRDQFQERLGKISEKMKKNDRAIFVVDPEKYMQEDSDQAWAIVIKQLPDKIKFVFAQRPEDVMVKSEMIGELENVVRIPEKLLEELDERSVKELVEKRGKGLNISQEKLLAALERYKGHPYALQAALDLLVAGKIRLKELPQIENPTDFARVQWEKVEDAKAIRLLEAYAVLEVPVTDDIVEAVATVEATARKAIMNNRFMGGLLREEAGGKRIYHAILADHILDQIGDSEKQEYHGQAAEVYREKLRRAEEEQVKPDEQAAERLCEHVLAAEKDIEKGKEAFVKTLVDECVQPLATLGLLEKAIELSGRALEMVVEGSKLIRANREIRG